MLRKPLSYMNGPISFLHTAERKERPAGRPISLAIACTFPWSLLTLRRGIFVPLDRKFHVPKDHQHHYQRSHRRVALASIISVRRLIRARQWLLWKVGLFLARYLRAVSRIPLLAIAAQRGNLTGSLFDSGIHQHIRQKRVINNSYADTSSPE